MAKSILVKQTKGFAQTNPKQKNTLKAIGLRGIGSQVYRQDTFALRGMLNVVRHMIVAEQVEPSKTVRPVKAKSVLGGYTVTGGAPAAAKKPAAPKAKTPKAVKAAK